MRRLLWFALGIALTPTTLWADVMTVSFSGTITPPGIPLPCEPFPPPFPQTPPVCPGDPFTVMFTIGDFSQPIGDSYLQPGPIQIATGPYNFASSLPLATFSDNFIVVAGLAVNGGIFVLLQYPDGSINPDMPSVPDWRTLQAAEVHFPTFPVNCVSASDQLGRCRGTIDVSSIQVTPIPEPATWLLLASGLALIALLRRAVSA